VNWYSARLLFESVHDPPERPSKLSPLFEESIVVFQADDDESVPAKLKKLAQAGEVEYEAIAGNQVRWEFREVLEVQEIGTDKDVLEDGIEVFYRWWHNPGPRAFKVMRETHQGRAWWLDEPSAESTETRR
jgi:hypothetical protein